MNRDSRSNTAFEALRKQAERILRGQRTEHGEYDEQDLMRLLYEVEVQQVELELQNDELSRTSRALEQSRDEFAELYQSAPVAYVTLNHKRMIEQLNAAAADMLCGVNGVLAGSPFSSLILPEDRDIYYSHLKKASSGLAPPYCELRLLTAQNRPADIQLHARIKDTAENGPFQWQLVLIDISARKGAERMMQDREARMASIFRAAPVGIGMVTNRVIQEVNDRFCEISGYPRDELVGQDARIIYPSDREYEYVGAEKYRQIQKRGTGSVETRLRRKNGRIIDVVISSTPIDPADHSLGVTFTVLDVTERKRAEEALRQSEHLYRSLATNLPNGAAFVVDRDLRYVLAEGEALRMAGMKPEDLEGRKIHEVLEPALADIYEPHYRAALGGREFQWEHFSHSRYYATHGVPLRDPRGGVYAVLAVSYDITERKEAEAFYRRYREKLEREVENRTTEIEAQYKELEALNDIIKKLSQKTIEAMESDRQALSKEIHDSIGGTLAAIKFQLEDRISHMNLRKQEPPSGLMPLETIVVHLKNAIREARRISNQLRSLTLDDFGLKPALIEHIGHFRQFYPGIEVIDQIDLSGRSIPPEVQTVVYRIVQEALNNVGRHSAATQVRIVLADRNDRLHLEIGDNGMGFDYRQALSEADPLVGFGIHNMQARVDICKGEFQIHSEPGKGTVVDVSIPV